MQPARFQLFRLAKVDSSPHRTQDKWPYDLCDGLNPKQIISVPLSSLIIKVFAICYRGAHSFTCL
jgi:hypothetical protein